MKGEYIIEKLFNDLEEAVQDLKEAYYEVSRCRGDSSALNQLEYFLKNEYDILESELQSDLKESHESQNPKLVEVKLTTVSVEDLEIGSGIVYLQSDEYGKTRDDIKKEDYENDSEYYTALQEETPGELFNSIRVLKGGWVECTNRLPSSEYEKSITSLYPPSSVKRISRSNYEETD